MRFSSDVLKHSTAGNGGGLRLFIRVCLFLLLAALYVFKYDGNDYSMYENYYELGTGFEIGYELLAALSRAFGFDFKYFYGMYSALNLLLFCMLCRWRTERMLLALIPLMLFPGLPLNTIRQLTASLICALAYDRFYPQENKKFSLLILVASQFHISSVLFLIPLAWKRIGVFVAISLISIAALAYFSTYTSYLTGKIVYYTGGAAQSGWYEQGAGKSFAFVLFGLMLLAGGFLWRVGDYRKYMPILLLAAVAMFASAYMSIFMRFIYLFLPAISVWMYSCSRRIKLMVFMPLFLVGVVNLYFVVAVWGEGAYQHRNHLIEYLSI
ncbi:TPA: EpsG family protein [Stenotrophomonas maltophilia]|uniref:EpsG family protein n=1 Tax=Stenotrophomonas maltophilia TaxID=40324 RepID=UPI0021DB5E82|nr:EpsG family protein [Stenotrophomonas maltophilia]UXY49858.1 EpsG family protein [Stenotrophomonas maltophilia]